MNRDLLYALIGGTALGVFGSTLIAIWLNRGTP